VSHPLSKRLSEGNVYLLPFNDDFIEPLREACLEDEEIWEIYPVSLYGEQFDVGFGSFYKHYLIGDWLGFAVIVDEELVGITNYLNPDPENGVVEIGGTYIQPDMRGTGVNDSMKRLMIEHAFASGYRKIEFRVDARNERSQAAVLKLGAEPEGILRQNRITWTGYIRDTMLFGLLEDEWRG
jgi:RimJ/RimL family protein N-acetyltransferase